MINICIDGYDLHNNEIEINKIIRIVSEVFNLDAVILPKPKDLEFLFQNEEFYNKLADSCFIANCFMKSRFQFSYDRKTEDSLIVYHPSVYLAPFILDDLSNIFKDKLARHVFNNEKYNFYKYMTKNLVSSLKEINILILFQRRIEDVFQDEKNNLYEERYTLLSDKGMILQDFSFIINFDYKKNSISDLCQSIKDYILHIPSIQTYNPFPIGPDV